MILHKRHQEITDIHLAITGLLTWRSRTTDATIWRKLLSTKKKDKNMTDIVFRTEVGVILNSMKLITCAMLAQMTEDGGPNHCRSAFGPQWMLYASPRWDVPLPAGWATEDLQTPATTDNPSLLPPYGSSSVSRARTEFQQSTWI